MSLSEILAGLITLTISSIVTIKSLSIAVKINKNNINIQGNNNTVINLQPEPQSAGEYTLLWNVLAVAIFFAYPFFGHAINKAALLFSVVGVPIAVGSWFLINRASGFNRIWNLFYIIGAAWSCWLLFHLAPYLNEAANRSGVVYARLVAMLKVISFTNFTAITPLLADISVIFGVTMIFLSTLYLVFGYIRARAFDSALRFSLSHSVIATISAFFASNGGLAVFFHDTPYIEGILKTLLPAL